MEWNDRSVGMVFASKECAMVCAEGLAATVASSGVAYVFRETSGWWATTDTEAAGNHDSIHIDINKLRPV